MKLTKSVVLPLVDFSLKFTIFVVPKHKGDSVTAKVEPRRSPGQIQRSGMVFLPDPQRDILDRTHRLVV